jgi:uncharacterized membrane protein YccC
VRLTVGEDVETHAFDVLPDPRVSTVPGELERQFELLNAIIERLDAANRTVNAVDALREQLRLLERRPALSEQSSPVRECADALGAELQALRGELIDVRYSEAQLWPTGLHEKLNALYDAVDSADRAPARQMNELFDLLCAQLDAVLERWRSVGERLVPELQLAMTAAGLSAVGMASIKEAPC